MAEAIVLDANVIVALLYEQDAKHADAKALIDRMSAASLEPQLVDFLVLEALSVLGRRAAERKTSPPDFSRCVELITTWRRAGLIRDLAQSMSEQLEPVLAAMAHSAGKMSANDALMVVLQRTGAIDQIATFDEHLASVEGFRRFL